MAHGSKDLTIPSYFRVSNYYSPIKSWNGVGVLYKKNVLEEATRL